MKIEVGKKYKTKHGKTVVIHSVSRKGKDGKTVIGEVLDTLNLFKWYHDGSYSDISINTDWDLVSEANEKLIVTFEMDIPKVFQKIDTRVIENACKMLTGGFKCSIYGTPLDTNWLLSELHHSEIKISLSDYKP